ncbi:MAG: flavodoxin family protein [Anaerolineae bacterium]|nr:flavodoxin family protein [Anaerolineae bacterium]
MKKVMIVYHSQQYGNTKACAELVARGVREAGEIEVELVNLNEAQRIDIDAFLATDGVALGTPDYFSYPAGTIKQLFDDLLEAYRKDKPVYDRPCALFVTHGGGGRAVEPFKRLARDFRIVGEPFVCRRAPEPDCPEAIALGRALGEAVLA